MKYVLSASLMIVAFSLSAMDVGGIISQDTTWDLQNSPYRLVSFLYIASGVTLTIEPGVQVQINGASIEIDWNGWGWRVHGMLGSSMFLRYIIRAATVRERSFSLLPRTSPFGRSTAP